MNYLSENIPFGNCLQHNSFAAIVPIMKLQKTQAAYIAGIMDGEGHFILYPQNAQRKGYLIPNVGFTQANVGLLKHVATMVGEGARINIRKAKRGSELRFTDVCMRWFLPEIIPYMYEKREQAILILEFLTIRHKRGRGSKALTDEEKEERMEIYWKLKALNAPNVYNEDGYVQ